VLRRFAHLLGARFRALLGPDAAGVRQSLVALALNSSTSLVAGAVLGSITGTFEELPGLLVLVPAAIGLRGNIFGAFGNRLSTTIHAGTFRLSARTDTVLGQNLLAAMLLTLSMSLALAVIAKAVGVVLGLENTIPLLDMALISILGGFLASLVVMAATVALTAGAVRYGWDLDNVTAPLVSTLGDVLTLPALYLATFVLDNEVVTAVLGTVLVAVGVGSLLVGWFARLELLRRIVHESVPILVTAGAISAMAGVVIEKRFDSFAAFPALLIMVPAHLSSSGALGGILSGRLSSKLFLGLVTPDTTPSREARRDIGLVFFLSLPIYLLNAGGAELVADLLGQRSPGIGDMVLASLLGGMLAMGFVLAIAYYGTIVAVRTGLDPDTYGIPVVSSSVDFVGAFSLSIAIVFLGIT
jgi:mgtE-like transporter